MALSSIHNFIHTHEPSKEPLSGNPDIPPGDNFDEDINPIVTEKEDVDVQ